MATSAQLGGWWAASQMWSGRAGGMVRACGEQRGLGQWRMWFVVVFFFPILFVELCHIQAW